MGRVALDNVVDVVTDQHIVKLGEIIDEDAADRVEEVGIEKIRVRSALTCEAKRGICAKCYGRDLATGQLAQLGSAVGIIGAQSIGEPGTQLTMRTFHIGGTASRIVEQSYFRSRNAGQLQYHSLKTVVTKTNEIVVLNRNGQLTLHDETGRELERYTIPSGAIIAYSEGGMVPKDEIFVKWMLNSAEDRTETRPQTRYDMVDNQQLGRVMENLQKGIISPKKKR